MINWAAIKKQIVLVSKYVKIYICKNIETFKFEWNKSADRDFKAKNVNFFLFQGAQFRWATIAHFAQKKPNLTKCTFPKDRLVWSIWKLNIIQRKQFRNFSYWFSFLKKKYGVCLFSVDKDLETN